MGDVNTKPQIWACADHALPGLCIDTEEEPRDEDGYPVERKDCYAHGCKRPGVLKLRWVPRGEAA